MFQWVPSPPSRDSNKGREMDFDSDDLRDYMDQDIPAGHSTTAAPGPISQFLTGMPDWMNMTPDDLNTGKENHPIPLSGISLHGGIEVIQRHDIQDRQYQNIGND